MKNQQAMLYGIIGFLLGVILTAYFASNAVNNNNAGMMRMMGIDSDRVMQQDEMMMMHGR